MQLEPTILEALRNLTQLLKTEGRRYVMIGATVPNKVLSEERRSGREEDRRRELFRLFVSFRAGLERGARGLKQQGG